MLDCLTRVKRTQGLNAPAQTTGYDTTSRRRSLVHSSIPSMTFCSRNASISARSLLTVIATRYSTMSLFRDDGWSTAGSDSSSGRQLAQLSLEEIEQFDQKPKETWSKGRIETTTLRRASLKHGSSPDFGSTPNKVGKMLLQHRKRPFFPTLRPAG